MPKNSPKQHDITCIGSALQDIFVNISDTESAFVRAEHLIMTLGAKINVDYPTIDLGGGATNAAVNMACQGLNTALISNIANDEAGERIQTRLDEKGISTELLHIDTTKDAQTGMSVILNVPGKDRTAMVSRGVSKHLDVSKINWDALKQSKWLYVASFGALKPDTDYAKIGQFAYENGMQIAFNPGLDQIKRGKDVLGNMVSQAAVLIMNVGEAAMLTGSNQKDRVTVILERLVALGPKLAVITDGKNGAFAAYGLKDSETAKRYFVLPPKVPTFCTLGAGDAFASTLVASIIHDGDTPWNIPQAMARAAMNAALVVQYPGAQVGLENFKTLDKLVRNFNIQAEELKTQVTSVAG